MTTPDQVPTNDKEYNFRALEAKYQAQLQQERSEREKLQQELEARNRQNEPEEDTSEPYVDHKKLNRTLAKHGQNTQSEIQKAMEHAKQQAKEELKQEMWLESNPDFDKTLNGFAEKFAIQNPKLADTILRMPKGFERDKLVYQNIKALKIDEPEVKQSTIQDKIDANRRTPYYQPSGVGAAPYASQGDFSPAGQKAAHDKMQELKGRLRLG